MTTAKLDAPLQDLDSTKSVKYTADSCALPSDHIWIVKDKYSITRKGKVYSHVGKKGTRELHTWSKDGLLMVKLGRSKAVTVQSLLESTWELVDSTEVSTGPLEGAEETLKECTSHYAVVLRQGAAVHTTSFIHIDDATAYLRWLSCKIPSSATVGLISYPH